MFTIKINSVAVFGFDAATDPEAILHLHSFFRAPNGKTTTLENPSGEEIFRISLTPAGIPVYGYRNRKHSV